MQVGQKGKGDRKGTGARAIAPRPRYVVCLRYCREQHLHQRDGHQLADPVDVASQRDAICCASRLDVGLALLELAQHLKVGVRVARGLVAESAARLHQGTAYICCRVSEVAVSGAIRPLGRPSVVGDAFVPVCSVPVASRTRIVGLLDLTDDGHPHMKTPGSSNCCRLAGRSIAHLAEVCAKRFGCPAGRPEHRDPVQCAEHVLVGEAMHAKVGVHVLIVHEWAAGGAVVHVGLSIIRPAKRLQRTIVLVGNARRRKGIGAIDRNRDAARAHAPARHLKLTWEPADLTADVAGLCRVHRVLDFQRRGAARSDVFEQLPPCGLLFRIGTQDGSARRVVQAASFDVRDNDLGERA